MNLARDQILVERRYVAVFETIADDVVSSLAVALPENLRDALARTVALPLGAFDETSTLAQRVRQGMVARKAIIDTGVLLDIPWQAGLLHQPDATRLADFLRELGFTCSPR